MADVDSLAGTSSEGSAILDSRAGAVSNHAMLVNAPAGFLSYHGVVDSLAGFIGGGGILVDSRGGCESHTLTESVFNFFVASALSPSSTPSPPVPPFVITCNLDGSGTYLPIRSWSMRRARGEQSTLRLVLDNEDGSLSPGVTTGPWVDLVNIDPFITSAPLDPPSAPYTIGNPFTIAPRHHLQMHFNVGGVERGSPLFLPIDYQVDDGPDASTVTLTCVDYSEMLYDPNHQMPDVDAVKSLRYAKEVTGEILSKFGFPNGSYSLLFEDFPIPKLHRVGTPIDWIKEIFSVRQAWWFCDGPNFIAKSGGYDRTKKPSWKFVDRQHVTMNSLRRTRQGAFNTATVERMDSTARSLSDVDGYGLGIVTVPLSSPTQAVNASVTVDGGKAYGFSWQDGGGNYVVGQGFGVPSYYGQTPVSQLQFTLEPVPPFLNGQSQWKYHASIRGTSASVSNALAWMGIGEDYSYRYVDPVDASQRGRHSFPAPFVKSIVPNKTVSMDFIQKLVTESEAFYSPIRTTMIFNPLVDPGEMVDLHIAKQKIGYDADGNFVDFLAMIHSIEADGDAQSAMMTLGMLRPRWG